MKNKVYVAYGSNMAIEQMAFRCPEATLLGTGALQNWRLMFKGSKTGAYATIEREKGCTVPILLWDITETDEAYLDHYEGFPNFYYKKNIMAETPEGKKKGMVYIMHEVRKLALPSERYYDILAKAYRKFGFDMKILEEAYSYSEPPLD